jgi:DNA repair exonuclease SbcCD ATPase subunit
VFSGCFLSIKSTEVQDLPLNKSVVFLEDRNVIVMNDAWRVAIELDTQVYEEAIATVRNDLASVDKQRKEFTPVAELKQVADLLNTLESRLANFQQLLPRLDRRRGLLTVLKTLFGTATLSDLNQLHRTIDELKSKEADIVHSLASQLTYVKELGQSTRVNADAISKNVHHC